MRLRGETGSGLSTTTAQAARDARQAHPRTVELKARLDDQFFDALEAVPGPKAAQPPAQLLARALAKIEAQSSPPPAPRSGEVPHAGKLQRLRASLGIEARELTGRKVYGPSRDLGRHLLNHAGKMARKYITAREPDEYNRRWMALEDLHKKGAFSAAFGHVVGEGTVEAMSKVVASRADLQHLAAQTKAVGRDLVLANGETVKVKPAKQSLAMGVSGMSFPQLSAPSVLSLLYAHVKHAKDGVHYLLNTGEGGPLFHLALLEGDEEGLRQQIIRWGLETGELKEGSLDHAKVEVALKKLMQDRNALFQEFSQEDLEQAQIVAQFGSALNGIRGADGRIDFRKLAEIGQNPHVAMVEFKLKQAAKRGSKVDTSKMNHVAAAMREVSPSQPFKSPPINPDLGSYQDIATAVLATKLVTHKPVSLKLAVGDVENIHEFLEYLARMDALPDQIQVDGGGRWVSPGSGNAPPTGAAGNTSLNAREATLVVEGILTHLGVRDEVNLLMSGEVMLPTDALEAMTLGADGVVGARTWMNMGLGCAKVGTCNSGGCPYGIASRSGSVFAASLDPQVTGPKAYQASKEWRETLIQQMSETGALDWRVYRKTHGLHARQDKLTIRQGQEQLPIRDVYDVTKAVRLLGDVMDEAEIRSALYEQRPPELVAFDRFDASRRLVNFLHENLDQSMDRSDEIDAFVERRLDELATFLEEPRTGVEILRFIRQVPDELMMPGARVLASDEQGSAARPSPGLEIPEAVAPTTH